MRSDSRDYGEKAYQKESVLRELYIEENHSLDEIADILGTNYYRVYKWYDKYGIEKTDEDRFIHKYEINEDTCCWEWTAATDKDGYGVHSENGEYIRAHRFSYKTHNGEIPEGMFVLHSCHNPPCVNPDHLHTGDGKDNMRDAIEAGRFTGKEGLRKGRNKLSKEDVIEIRQTYNEEDVTMTDLSERYGVALPTMSDLLKGKTWEDVGGPIVERARYFMRG